MAFYSGDKAERKLAKEAEKAEKAEKKGVREEIVYPDADYTEGYNPNADAEAEEARKAEKALAKAEKREAQKQEKADSMEAAYVASEERKLEKEEKKDELLLIYKEEKERLDAAKQAKKAERKAERAESKKEEEIIYPDFTDDVNNEIYDEETGALTEAKAPEALPTKREERQADRAERQAAKDEIALAAYATAAGKDAMAEEKKDALISAARLDKSDKAAKSMEERAELLIADKQERTRPEPTVEYGDPDTVLDGLDKELAESLDGSANSDGVIITKREEKLADRTHRAEASDVVALEDYDVSRGKAAVAKEKKDELLATARVEKADKAIKTAEERADLAREYKASKAAPETKVYPDPEFVPDVLDVDLVSALESGDFIEGTPVTLTADPDYRRIEKENKRLELLIKHGKKRAKKKAMELQTLEIADKYTDSGALALADRATIVKDAKFYKQEKRDLKAVRAYEASIEEAELIEFEREYTLTVKKRKQKLKKAKKSGKFSIEYGSTFDPEYDGEFNNFGMSPVDLLTPDVKLTTSRRARRQPKREKLSHFDKKRLTTLANAQCDTDNRMVEARVRAEFLALELDVAKSEWSFSGDFETRKERRWRKESKKKLLTLKSRVASAVKFEKLDNKRYYSVVATNFDTVELPKSADRDDLIVMRDELMRLLDIRDEINTQLLDLYTGTENGMRGSLHGRVRAELGARRRAYRKYRKLHRILSKKRVTRQEKLRIFDKMDEVLELRGELARLNYILRKEKPDGRLLNTYKKEKKKIKREIRVLRKVIDHISIKALKRAKKRSIRIRTMVISYAILILLVLGIFAAITMGPQLLEMIKPYLPENIASFIDSLNGGAV